MLRSKAMLGAAAFLAGGLVATPALRADLHRPDAQDQCRRRGGAAERGAHGALCGEGARLLRQALHRRQHHPVRRRRRRHLGHRGRPGLGDLEPARHRDRAGAQGAADLGPRAAPAPGLRRERRHQDARRSQGQAALRGRRHRRLQLAGRPRRAARRRAHRERCPVHLAGDGGAVARLRRRPDRRRRAASGRPPHRARRRSPAPMCWRWCRTSGRNTASTPTARRSR